MSGRANAPHAWYNCAMRARFALLLLCLTAAGPLPDELADGGSARVVAVVDGDTVRLDDGRELRLVGIQVTTRFAVFHPGSFSTQKSHMNPVIPPQNIFTLFHRAPRRIFCLVTPMSPQDSWA